MSHAPTGTPPAVACSMASANRMPGVPSPSRHFRTFEAVVPTWDANARSVRLFFERCRARSFDPVMTAHVHRSAPTSQYVPPGERLGGQAPPHMALAQIDVVEARQNWVLWMRWYLDNYPGEVPTKTALAKRLRVSKSALTPLLDLAGTRAPSFETLVESRNLTGLAIDLLITTPPPTLGHAPKGRRNPT